jgi:hypothetical protein
LTGDYPRIYDCSDAEREVIMTTLKDVVKLADTGFVSIARLEKELSLPRDKACRALLACWDRGLLLPVVESYFAPPQADGTPVQMRNSENASRESWYAEEVKQLRQVFSEHDEDGELIPVALTVNDLKEELGIDGRANPLRQALKFLVEQGEIQSFTATAGGAFGHRPIIYGNNMSAFHDRNVDLKLDAEKRKAERKSGANAPPVLPPEEPPYA